MCGYNELLIFRYNPSMYFRRYHVVTIFHLRASCFFRLAGLRWRACGRLIILVQLDEESLRAGPARHCIGGHTSPSSFSPSYRADDLVRSNVPFCDRPKRLESIQERLATRGEVIGGLLAG